MMCSAMVPKAKVPAGPRCSRRHGSFSAAADLVVKPAMPPKRISGGVANASVVAGLVANGSKVDVMPDIAGTAIKLASPPQRDSTKVDAVETRQEEGVTEEVATEKLSHQALVEVRAMSGKSILKEHFLLSDRVLSVKHRVQKKGSFPLWQQMLSCQGEMLIDESTLGELSLLQDAVFDLVLKSGPSPEEMEALADVAREALTVGTNGMKTLTKFDIREVRAFESQYRPLSCEKVCAAALHVLAGLAPQIPIKQDGNPKLAGWSGCKLMMEDGTSFIKQVLELPLCIDQGRMMKERVAKCRQLIHSIEGDSESEKILHVSRGSLMCQQLITFLFGVVKYYDGVAEFRERFGGATITELKSHQ